MTFPLTIVFMIMVFWRPQEWLVPWMFGWPVLDVIVCAAAISAFLESERGYMRIPWRKPQIWLLGGLWAATLMSHVAHTYFDGMLMTMTAVFKICFFTMLLFCVMDRPSRLRTVAVVFVAMSCVMSVHALMQDRTGYGFGGQTPIYIRPVAGNPGYTRSLFYGIFGDPNDMAQMLASSIPLAFAIPRRRSIRGFIFSWSVAGLMIAAMLTTHSRGGIVSLLTVAAVMLALAFPPRVLPTFAVVILVGALMLCPMAEAYMDTSAHDRIVFWGLANQVFKENLMFGLGWGMFWEVGTDKAAHNAFVSCYTTIGLFGYWFWFCLLHVGVVGAWRTRVALRMPETEDDEWIRRYTGLGLAAMAGYCASAYFLSRAFLYPYFFLVAILGALPVVAERCLPEGHPPLVNPKIDVFVTGTITSLGSIAYIYVTILLLNKAIYG